MKRLLQWVFLGHVHKWVEYKQGTITTPDRFSTHKRTIGIAVFCSCEKCGEHRVFRLIGSDD